MSWAFLSNFAAPIKAQANQFLRNQAAAAIRKSGLDTLRQARGTGLSSELANLRLTVNTPVIQGAGLTVGGVSVADVLNRTGAVNPQVPSKPQQRGFVTAFLEDNINKAGRNVDSALSNFFGKNTPEFIQQYGREQEKKGWGGALETASTVLGPPGIGNIVSPILGSVISPFIPNSPPVVKTTPLQRARVGDPMILGGRLGYKGADGQWHQRGEILEGDILNTLPTGPGFGTPPVPPVLQLSPEERAYNQERSRIAQLTSATPEERSKLRDEGMRIWAAKYGDLAKKVKPGQSGYKVIQEVLNK